MINKIHRYKEKTFPFVCIVFVLLTSCKKDNNDDNGNTTPDQTHFSVQWNNRFNFWLNNDACLHNLAATADGGAVLFFPWFTDDNDGTCLMKISSAGVTEFQQVYPVTDFGCAYASVLPVSGNGYLLYGHYAFPVFGKTDAAGNILWKKEMNFHNLLRINCITEKPDGGFLALATTFSSIYIIDMNAAGDTNRCILLRDTLANAEGVQIEYNHSKEIIVTYSGKTDNRYAGFVTALDSNFNEKWAHTFNSSDGHIFLNAFCINNDNSMVAAGSYSLIGSLIHDTYIAGISPDGLITFTKNINNEAHADMVLDIEPAPSGGYYVVAYHDPMITKINTNGEALWRESLDPSNQLGPSGNTIKATGNSVYFLGNTIDFTSLNMNPVLIKFTEP
ncbi:MAG TPA: hypothetical protein PKW80_01140 [Bacteroidales bacterium]|nr:hypothetical protein [Bacteroidales bacterium]